jgi:phage shock protein C
MKENPDIQEKKEMKNLKGSFFEVPGVPISDPKGESDKKKTTGSFIEIPGRPIFSPKEGLETKSEEKINEKKPIENTILFEREEQKESDFKAPGELGKDYKEKPWVKPEKDMEEQVTERTEEIRQTFVEEAREGEVSEAREREVKEKEAEEREVKEKEEREREVKEKEAEEKETREKEAKEREEKRTVYTMEKRLTRSKTERMIFGVCGGMGEYLGIDPTLVRLAFALLTLFSGGIGLVLYIILTIIVPLKKDIEMFPNSRK